MIIGVHASPKTSMTRATEQGQLENVDFMSTG
jgi:hypothetical protein